MYMSVWCSVVLNSKVAGFAVSPALDVQSL